MEHIYIHYRGVGELTLPCPELGQSFTFRPKPHRNKVRKDAWDALKDPVSGAAYPYIKARHLVPTTDPGGLDQAAEVRSTSIASSSGPAAGPKRDTALAAENDGLRAEVDRLRTRLREDDDPRAGLEAENARLRAEIEALRAEADAPADAAPEGGLSDPGSMTVDELAAAVAGKSSDALSDLVDAERVGKNRKGAIEALEAEMAVALEREG